MPYDEKTRKVDVFGYDKESTAGKLKAARQSKDARLQEILREGTTPDRSVPATKRDN
jgi:hypothetical protein